MGDANLTREELEVIRALIISEQSWGLGIPIYQTIIQKIEKLNHQEPLAIIDPSKFVEDDGIPWAV